MIQIHVDVIKVENIGMTDMLNGRMGLHPLAPPIHYHAQESQREGGTSVHSRTIHSPHAHVVIVERGRGHLAVHSTEVVRILLGEIVSRGDHLQSTEPNMPT